MRQSACSASTASAQARPEGADPLRQDLHDVAAGDPDAVVRLRVRSLALLWKVVLRIVPQRAVAEEVLQEVYLRIWMHASSFDPARASARTWICAIARHTAIDLARRQQAEPTMLSLDRLLEHEDGELAVHDGLWDGQDLATLPQPLADRWPVQRLDDELAALPGGQRQCLVLAYQQGLSQNEVARHLRLPLGTVKSWLRRAQVRLRTRLVAPLPLPLVRLSGPAAP